MSGFETGHEEILRIMLDKPWCRCPLRHGHGSRGKSAYTEFIQKRRCRCPAVINADK